MSAATRGLAQSVHTQLVRHAQSLRVDVNLLLTRFATERFLYRLSRSPHAERFVLKGALLMLVWFGETIRPTRDADLLGFGDFSDEALTNIFQDICAVEVEPDAMIYLKDSIRVSAIRPEDAYGGRRVTLGAQLGSARLRVQVDVGIGDAVLPPPEWLDYPSLLELPRPRLRAYRPETVIAEKFHAMVVLGAKNSRMRDFFDVYILATLQSFDGEPLAGALRATFERRRTAIPCGLPLALTPEFVAMPEKQAQWRAFLKKNGLASAPDDLGQVIRQLAPFLEPVIKAAQTAVPFVRVWKPGGTWR
ncbi:MAG: nucleotidyl transferase AbiEii/AbiGii toxin family protein [Nitrospirae bacterium]|nr:nucleotidyl transferase AbiEii/AbiGii toxin family protein [Nitrospirota bacterium]